MPRWLGEDEQGNLLYDTGAGIVPVAKHLLGPEFSAQSPETAFMRARSFAPGPLLQRGAAARPSPSERATSYPAINPGRTETGPVTPERARSLEVLRTPHPGQARQAPRVPRDPRRGAAPYARRAPRPEVDPGTVEARGYGGAFSAGLGMGAEQILGEIARRRRILGRE